MRAPTYYQKCKDQQWYISQLLNTNAKQATHINELKERIRELDGSSNAGVDLDRPVVEPSNAAETSVTGVAPSESQSVSHAYQAEASRVFPDFFGSDIESDDGSDREESNASRRTERVFLLLHFMNRSAGLTLFTVPCIISR